uniref:Uncharacterized protein n=1 Tax=Candidatus Kentrum sp. FM TaxID=2126340 RepID=A0A450WJ71_9GAMM|nr:MAG: hypothetical protein BECKFM1743A_GA0114220_109041 [Candidatus Kentron sp. FM]VFJ76629.1 MAG: hypothetical protein BECKFM1743C_GA0114222_109391 [Candidatus Kentron sp. FM]VFK17069.1 MAG: hypothetical protein BECKFM1743B_GA0114221_104586 [Candidatus Kentron sp. FM]
MITFDEAKRVVNRANHGLDFLGCEAIFDGPVLAKDDTRLSYGEQRINLIGFLRGSVVCPTYTERGDDLHVISLRKATSHETKHFARWISQ